MEINVLCRITLFKTLHVSHCSPVLFHLHSVCNITFRTNKSIQIPTTLFYRRLLVYLAVGQLVNKSIPNDMEGRHYGQSRNRSYNNSMLT